MSFLKDDLNLKDYEPLTYQDYEVNVKEDLMPQKMMDVMVETMEAYRKIAFHTINECLDACAGKDAAGQTRALEEIKKAIISQR